MIVKDSYSPWTRNRMTPALKDAIRNAGEGEVRYGPATGHPRGYVACVVVNAAGIRGRGVGPNPHAAFTAALVGLHEAERVELVTLLNHGSAA